MNKGTLQNIMNKANKVFFFSLHRKNSLANSGKYDHKNKSESQTMRKLQLQNPVLEFTFFVHWKSNPIKYLRKSF